MVKSGDWWGWELGGSSLAGRAIPGASVSVDVGFL